MDHKRSENLRIARNCDGITNKNLFRRSVGLVPRCPNALDARVYRAFRWAQEWARSRVLPYAGFDFAGQPAFVAQAIREVEAETLETSRKMSSS